VEVGAGGRDCLGAAGVDGGAGVGGGVGSWTRVTGGRSRAMSRGMSRRTRVI
jgi:hypothetical protein